MTNKTSSKPAATYTLADLQARQEREGYNFGFLRHEIHDTHVGPMRAKRVIAWLQKNGFDKDDAYQALNSRNARHLGDWLMDADILPEEIERRIASSLWSTPAGMYEDFGQTKEQLAEKVGKPLTDLQRATLAARIAAIVVQPAERRLRGLLKEARPEIEALNAEYGKENVTAALIKIREEAR